MLEGERYRPIGPRAMEALPQLQDLPTATRRRMRAVAEVLPFRVNRYVVEELIDWGAAPYDPLFRLCFPHEDMLPPGDIDRVLAALDADAPKEELQRLVHSIRDRLEPNPASQEENLPPGTGRAIQHKYRETVLYFPSRGQQCHLYCSFCFRWSQFTGDPQHRFAGRDPAELAAYVAKHPAIESVLLTGGDPLIMGTRVLRRIIAPLLDIPHVSSIRIGTKALASWPARFTTDRDADELLRLFEEVVGSGRHLAVMGHYVHPRELSTQSSEAALQRVQATGAVVRSQGPVLRGINDDPQIWADLWRTQVRQGVVPYYQFMPRPTGAFRAFAVPLRRALAIYQGASSQVSGLARTARGPVMSADPGKVQLVGMLDGPEDNIAVLRLIQSRDPELAGAMTLARLPSGAKWLDELEPMAASGFPWDRS